MNFCPGEFHVITTILDDCKKIFSLHFFCYGSQNSSFACDLWFIFLRKTNVMRSQFKMRGHWAKHPKICLFVLSSHEELQGNINEPVDKLNCIHNSPVVQRRQGVWLMLDRVINSIKPLFLTQHQRHQPSKPQLSLWPSSVENQWKAMSVDP